MGWMLANRKILLMNSIVKLFRCQKMQQLTPVIKKIIFIMDEELQELIARICENPISEQERKRTLNRLLSLMQRLPGLLRSSHLYYLEALDKTWEWVSRSICDFEPQPNLSIQKSLLKWINGYLKWRIRDLYLQTCNEYSLDSPIDNSGEDGSTLLDRLSETNYDFPVLSGIDGYIEQLRNQEVQRVILELENYILEDPEGRLRQCHPRNRPECNCQFLSQRRLFQNPPERFTAISKELGIPDTTIKSHWERRCKPLLKTILNDLGYSRE